MNLTLTASQLISKIETLKVNDRILLSGTIYTARDAAHQRLVNLIIEHKPLPLNLKDSIIYYCGPAPAKPGNIIGPCGPTTSSRMDSFTPIMLANGVKAVIGKGPRSKETIESLKLYKAVYLVATGGVAALISRTIKSAELIAFGDLGPEAVMRLEVSDFPVTVANDIYGNDIFKKQD